MWFWTFFLRMEPKWNRPSEIKPPSTFSFWKQSIWQTFTIVRFFLMSSFVLSFSFPQKSQISKLDLFWIFSTSSWFDNKDSTLGASKLSSHFLGLGVVFEISVSQSSFFKWGLISESFSLCYNTLSVLRIFVHFHFLELKS